MRIHAFLLATALFGLAACSSTASLDYTPTVPIIAGPSTSISAITAIDQRDEKPNRLATVRGGFGNPFYVRDTVRPVAEEVAIVFTKALQARGMISSQGIGPYRIQLVLRTFDANKYINRVAGIDIDLLVIDQAGSTIYKDNVKTQSDKFVLFDADIDALQKLAVDLLNATADRMLDNPKFRAAINGRRSVGAPAT